MPASYIVDKYQAIQYTGSNSAEIDGLITNFDIISESGGTLNFESPSGIPYTAHTNDYVRFAQGTALSVASPSDFNFLYVRSAVAADIDALNSRVDDLESAAPALLAAGVKEAPTLLFSQSTNVAVDVTPALPSTSYTPHVQLFASATALGSLSVTGVSVTDADTVTVTVQNAGLVSLTGVHILVTVTA